MHKMMLTKSEMAHVALAVQCVFVCLEIFCLLQMPQGSLSPWIILPEGLCWERRPILPAFLIVC